MAELVVGGNRLVVELSWWDVYSGYLPRRPGQRGVCMNQIVGPPPGSRLLVDDLEVEGLVERDIARGAGFQVLGG